MRTRSSIAAVGTALLSALGAAGLHCSSSQSSSSADGGAAPIPGTVAPACEHPTALLVDGGASGYETCEDGTTRRVGPAQCGNALPRDGGGACRFELPDSGSLLAGQCGSDSDCSAQPYGHCEYAQSTTACFCQYGCTKDSDCAAGNVCACNVPYGRCVPASCTDGASCPGAMCIPYQVSNCGDIGFACSTPRDTCVSDKDCAAFRGAWCGFADGGRRCELDRVQCVTGRPFLVAGRERVAPTAARGDWLASMRPDVASLDAALRAELSARWTAIGQMEHASVAAFARFALELMSLGAPSELLAATAAAMADETEHARMCFSLASAYADRAIGPAPLDVTGCMEPRGDARMSMIANLVREGCIGETIAAVEAREAASAARDPVVRAVLEQIAEDETRHAELAYKTLAWAMRAWGSDARAAIAREVRSAMHERAVSIDAHADDRDLLAHGLVDARLRARLAAEALREIVGPTTAAAAA